MPRNAAPIALRESWELSGMSSALKTKLRLCRFGARATNHGSVIGPRLVHTVIGSVIGSHVGNFRDACGPFWVMESIPRPILSPP